MADWEEIKRLAADFQRTQTSDTLQKISERNCIDIIKKLTELSLIELIYTCDGREFITPEHLLREIEDEIYVNGGRVHLHDLASNLNVDYQHVENKAKELAREKSDEYNLILGQIIHSTYKTTLGKQIYDTLITTGELSIADFSKSLDLPSEFLLVIVKELLPQLMDDYVSSPDERTYYTSDMMDRYKSIVAGTLSAIAKPTTIAAILKKFDIPERMFTPIVDGLIKEGRIDATIENRLYIPSVYAREQNEWIDKFYSANSYIDYDVLSRKDIKQPKAFLKKRFPEGIPLKTCFVSASLVSQVELMVEDCIASNGLLDVSTIVPASLQPDDIELILQDILKRAKQLSTSCILMQQTNVCSLGFIATCKKSFSELMSAKAKEHLKDGKLVRFFFGGDVKSQPRSRQQSEHKDEEQRNKSEASSKDASQMKDATGDRKQINEETVGSHNPSVEQDLSKDNDVSGPDKQISRSIGLTAEDLKREKRNRKGKQRVDDSLIFDNAADSDEDQTGKKGPKGSSRKSGGGTQGREIKQKSTKKKYLAGKGRQQNNENSDEDLSTTKAPRSNKGRAAKRAISPSDRSTPTLLGSGGQKQTVSSVTSKNSRAAGKNSTVESSTGVPRKESLEFMSNEELVAKLKEESRDSGEFAEGTLETIASMIVGELNDNYEQLARKTLDDHLRSSGGSSKKNEGKSDSEQDATEDRESLPGDEDIDFVE